MKATRINLCTRPSSHAIPHAFQNLHQLRTILVMKEFLICVIVILLAQGCKSKVEIPVLHVGVVKAHEQVDTAVLNPGEHLIDLGSEVIIYDTSPASLDIEFDFLFSDSSEGNLRLEIEFSPIVDSLSAFYRKYQSIYVTPIVDQGTRKVVRSLLLNFKPSDLAKDEFELEIRKAITTNDSIMNYIQITKIDIVEFR
jgi:hypothetical protein